MSRKERIHEHINAISDEVLAYIKEREDMFADRWVPASEIKNDLELAFVSVPKANKQYGPKGWLFAIVARMLEDANLVEFRKVASRSYYRSTRS